MEQFRSDLGLTALYQYTRFPDQPTEKVERPTVVAMGSFHGTCEDGVW